MLALIEAYWPHILAGLSVILGVCAATHAAMTKEDVRAAIGWVGVIILSPIVGALIYGLIGVNRMRRKNLGQQRQKMREIEEFHFKDYDVPGAVIDAQFGRIGMSMKHIGDRVTRGHQTSGNTIVMFSEGDDAYDAMLEAINTASHSIILETYIFDSDPVGKKFVGALAAAVKRGVTVRVLIDAVGARYSFPSVVHTLKKHGVPVGIFNGNIIIGLRLPYANLRTHRKILVVDGQVAFTGGMNIRVGFSARHVGEAAFHDTHFCLRGPAVADLFHAASEDWRFSTGEKLDGKPWFIPAPALEPGSGTFVRVIPSGPDQTLEANHKTLIGAFSVAEKHIRIKTPYLLPDREFISALVTAARRGVRVDIVVPGQNNLKMVDRAMRAQFDQLLRDGCRIWRARGPFNHSKLMSIDDEWAYVGTSNLDPRSLRLNFEVDLEVMDCTFAREIGNKIEESVKNGDQVLLSALKKRPFVSRLFDRIIWLGSPYL